jgi:CRP-like cAMP-binding protein
MEHTTNSGGNLLLKALLRDCRSLHKYLERVTYPLGYVVGLQNRPLTHVYFPTDGSVLSVLLQLKDGGTAEAMTVSKEGMIGLPIWLGIKRNLSQIVQQGPGELLRISGRAFCRGIEGSKRAATLLKQFTAYSLRFGYQTAVCNAHHSVEQRMCRWLLITADRLEGSKIRLSQALLAYMLGTRRQSVGAVAAKLQSQALISYQRANIEITDRLELEKRSCECYHALRQAYGELVGALR